MRIYALILTSIWSALSGGCASYTAAQLALIDQARKGVAVWQGRETARDDDVKRTFDAKRKALDDAFDADARQRAALDATWAIEARRGYAAGLSALAQAEQAALAANGAARRDAAATDATLAKLAWLVSLQSDVQSLFSKGGNP